MTNDIEDFLDLIERYPIWIIVPVLLIIYFRDFINDLFKHHFLDDDS